MTINKALIKMSCFFDLLILDGGLSDEDVKTLSEVETTICNFVKEHKHD